jgi:hypothetical protein
VSIFKLARLMGTSMKMIDRTYGHLAQDSEEAIGARLEARCAADAESVTEGRSDGMLAAEPPGEVLLKRTRVPAPAVALVIPDKRVIVGRPHAVRPEPVV